MCEPGEPDAAQHDDQRRSGDHDRVVHAAWFDQRDHQPAAVLPGRGRRSQPTSESEILFEVWLPLENWNGKFAGVGNGGWAGTISFGPLADQLRRGYARASTNTGHRGCAAVRTSAKFAFDHPEQLIDFAYRAHHETTLRRRRSSTRFTASHPNESYWIGCSSGGYEGLHGSAALPCRLRRHRRRRAGEQLDAAHGGGFRRHAGGPQGSGQQPSAPPRSDCSIAACSRRATRATASRTACSKIRADAASIPRRCSARRIRRPDTCLTAAQVEAATRVYRGPKDPKTGAQLYPGLSFGSEPFWPNRDPANPFPIPIAHYKWLVFADPNWDWKSFDCHDPSDYQAFLRAEVEVRADPQRHQSRSPGVPPAWWQAAPVSRLERSADRAAKQHRLLRERRRSCSAGRANVRRASIGCSWPPARHTVPADLVRTRSTCRRRSNSGWNRAWRQNRSSPRASTNGVVDRLRPLCPYPKVAMYKGKGDTNDAANFVCRDP